MRNRISILRLSLSLLASFILLISIVIPNTLAQGDSVKSRPISAIKNTTVENKIDSKLINQFKDQDQITFLLNDYGHAILPLVTSFLPLTAKEVTTDRQGVYQ